MENYTYKDLLKDNNVLVYEIIYVDSRTSLCSFPVRKVYLTTYLNGKLYEKECVFPMDFLEGSERLDSCINKMYEFLVHKIEEDGYTLTRKTSEEEPKTYSHEINPDTSAFKKWMEHLHKEMDNISKIPKKKN